MSFMFHNDQWDDNWDQYKVDLELENKQLRKENQNLKLQLVRMYGFGLQDSKKALDIFDWDINKALHYLQLRGDAVCRKKPNGRHWTEQDYIDYVNNFDKQ